MNSGGSLFTVRCGGGGREGGEGGWVMKGSAGRGRREREGEGEREE